MLFLHKIKINCRQTNYLHSDKYPPDGCISFIAKRASYAASLSLEAALTLPLFIAGLMALIFFLIVIQTQIHIQKALYNQTMNMAGYAYYAHQIDKKSEFKNFLEAEYVKHKVINELGTDYLDKSFIENGSRGIHLSLLTDSVENVVDVTLKYKLRVPYDLLSIGTLQLVSRARCHTWVGDICDNEAWNNEMVYMTKTGTVYHLYPDCSYLTSDLKCCKYEQIRIKRNNSGGKYEACKVCGDKVTSGCNVYYTEYGDHYHSSPVCGTLISNVYSVRKDEVMYKYKVCSKCLERSMNK